MASEFSRIFRGLGFSFVTLDLEGFRSGSMNALLPIEHIRMTGS
jgi:pyridinium-3,5-biscarboxylic acid mononucleotide sulfurtransferase